MINKNLYETKPNEDITSLEELLECLKIFEKNKTSIKWIFRGQEKQDDPIFITGIESAAKNFIVENNYRDDIKEFENKLLREFIRKLHSYKDIIPNENNSLEYLALMEHYGAPTRLSNWTYSFFVALYFALEKTISKEIDRNKDIECDIWALNYNWFTACKRVLPEIEDITKKINKENTFELQNAIINHLIKSPLPLVYPVNPFRLNERLVIQQGVFLFPGDISLPFDDNLCAPEYSYKSKENLLRFKIKLNISERNEVFHFLYRMNISRTTLFPGLAGFAESLKIRLAFPETLGYESN